MKNFINITFVLTLLVMSLSAQIVQTQKTTTQNIIKLEIKPSTTDARITAADRPHLILYNPSDKQGKLLLFMPGTFGIATKGPRALFNTALNQGYRVINLSYINEQAASIVCRGDVLVNEPDCAEKFRIKRIYGENVTSVIPDENQDAIINRFTKLLQHLIKTDKSGNWERYLQNGKPNWEEIAVSGQSQGGGMAAFIAKRNRVARVITFSGGWDYGANKKIASWYYKESATPADRWYGVYHVEEPTSLVMRETYEAMAIPKNHIYALNLPYKEGRKPHGEGISNVVYKPQWIELLGKEN